MKIDTEQMQMLHKCITCKRINYHLFSNWPCFNIVQSFVRIMYSTNVSILVVDCNHLYDTDYKLIAYPVKCIS